MEKFRDYPLTPFEERAWRFIFGGVFGATITTLILSTDRVKPLFNETVAFSIIIIFGCIFGLILALIPKKAFSEIMIVRESIISLCSCI